MQHPNHPDHDLTLIAAHTAGDLSDPERMRAQGLIDTCGACADLHRDLTAIAAATRSLPTRATAPRDFRLTPEQASQLRRRGWLRSILAPFGTGRSAVRPIAAAFTSLGIAGLLVATFLPGLMGSAASLGTDREQSATGAGASAAPALPGAGAPVPTSASAPDVRPAAGGPTAAPGNEFGTKDGNTATGAPEVQAVGGSPTEAPSAAVDLVARADTQTATTNPLLVGSFALLGVGLLLFGLRFASRRLR